MLLTPIRFLGWQEIENFSQLADLLYETEQLEHILKRLRPWLELS